MRREWRLRQTTDFDRARGSGRSWASPLLACYVFARGDSDPARIGITVGRRTGNAVVRNRVRRRIRELVRGRHPALAPGIDVVLIARPPSAQATFDDLDRSLASLLQRAGVLDKPGKSQVSALDPAQLVPREPSQDNPRS
jgi:ribonuclease P protein component